MQTEWNLTTLADACSAINYGLTASAVVENVGPRFLRITDIVSGHIDWKTVPHVDVDDITLEKYRLRDGDIVLARTGASTGASCYIKNPPTAVFASYLVRLRAVDSFDPRFLSYYLKGHRFLSFIRGVIGDKSAQPNASASTMTQAPLLAPTSKEKQRYIAHVLGTLDAKIELDRSMNETLEEMAKTLFKSWFVNFDPVRAKMEGRWHPGESLPGLPADLYDLFPDRLVNSELGSIPEGWQITTAGEAMTVKGGTTPKTKEPAYWDGKHWFATPKDLSPLQEPILSSTSRRLTGAGVSRIGSGLLPTGTLLLSSRAPIGYLAITQSPVAVNQGIIAMICDGTVGTHYALNWTHGNLAIIKAYATGTTFSEISKSSFRSIPFLVPSVQVHGAWESIVAPLYSRIASNVNLRNTLAHKRDALLPLLLSGKLGVKVPV